MINDIYYNFTLILPDSGMEAVYTKVAKEFPCKLTLFKNGERDIKNTGFSINPEECDVILCRRMFCEELKNYTSIPIVSIELVPIDILRLLLPYKGKVQRVALFRANSPLSYVDDVGHALDMEIHQFCFDTTEMLSQQLQSLPPCFDLLIGGMHTFTEGLQYGFKAINIIDEEDVARRSLANAFHFSKEKFNASSLNMRFDFLFHSISDGFIILDTYGNIQNINSAAENLLNCLRASVINHDIFSVFNDFFFQSDLESHTRLTRVATIGNVQAIVHITPLFFNNTKTGTIIHFTKLQKEDTCLKKNITETHPSGFTIKYTFDDIKTTCASVKKLKDLATLYAVTDSNILLTGESGTGKELFAQSMHHVSDRRAQPFVAVNCAAIPEGLLESELFGYEEGAFTGANRTGKMGMFELANKGTLFLDEVGDLPLTLQSRLLRVLQEREILRLGGVKLIPLDIRIICATHRNLAEKVRNGTFRGDLFYRLNVLSLIIPSLRHRTGDILYLTKKYLEENMESPPSEKVIHAELGGFLQDYRWPGNVRELYNVLDRLIIISKLYSNTMTLKERLDIIWQSMYEQEPEKNSKNIHTSKHLNLKERLAHVEQEIIQEALTQYDFDFDLAAKSLGISRMTLWRKRKNT